MNTLTLQWQNGSQTITQDVKAEQTSKNPGTVRIGRDPQQCDIVLTHGTVSGLHVEIFFHPQQQIFYIKNLRETNPPRVDSQQLIKGEMPLKIGSIIFLGQQKLQVADIKITPNLTNKNVNITHPLEIKSPQLQIQQKPQKYQQTPPTQPKPVYSLQCPKCEKVSPMENLKVGCRWCGTSLAGAISILVVPGK